MLQTAVHCEPEYSCIQSQGDAHSPVRSKNAVESSKKQQNAATRSKTAAKYTRRAVQLRGTTVNTDRENEACMFITKTMDFDVKRTLENQIEKESELPWS